MLSVNQLIRYFYSASYRKVESEVLHVSD